MKIGVKYRDLNIGGWFAGREVWTVRTGGGGDAKAAETSRAEKDQRVQRAVCVFVPNIERGLARRTSFDGDDPD